MESILDASSVRPKPRRGWCGAALSASLEGSVMMVIDPFRFVLACCFLPARNGMLAQLIRGKRF